jgi:uncharacterized protein (DUF1499 family)
MEVSGRIHKATALIPGKAIPNPNEPEAVWTQNACQDAEELRKCPFISTAGSSTSVVQSVVQNLSKYGG